MGGEYLCVAKGDKVAVVGIDTYWKGALEDWGVERLGLFKTAWAHDDDIYIVVEVGATTPSGCTSATPSQRHMGTSSEVPYVFRELGLQKWPTGSRKKAILEARKRANEKALEARKAVNEEVSSGGIDLAMMRCATANCPFRVHSMPEYGAYCCKTCLEEGPLAHGPKCQQVLAQAGAQQAPRGWRSKPGSEVFGID